MGLKGKDMIDNVAYWKGNVGQIYDWNRYRSNIYECKRLEVWEDTGI